MERAFYRVPEVAELLSIGKSLAYQLIQSGEIPSVRLAGRRSVRVPADGLQAFIDAQKSGDPKSGLTSS